MVELGSYPRAAYKTESDEELLKRGDPVISVMNQDTDFPKGCGANSQRLGLVSELRDRLSLPVSTSFKGFARMSAC